MGKSSIIPLALLRPTQLTVGLRQVKYKRKGLQKLAKRPAELMDFLLEHPVRVVRGPAERAYVIDHHHLGLALIKEKFETAPMQIEADFSGLAIKDFWKKMIAAQFVHPYDANGRKRALRLIPDHLKKLEDDPYRSLAGFVRMEGGFAKVETPFAEFAWADYFRAHVAEKTVNKHFARALKEALVLAAAKEAARLPGFLAGEE